jgi:membrane protein YdbS with pleckstrin-like domain
MAFTNLQLDPGTLPQAQELALGPMAPAYRFEVLVQWLIVLAPLFALSWLVYLLPLPPEVRSWLTLLPWLVLLLVVLLVWLAMARVAAKGYALREHDLAYRSGLVFRKTTLLPFNRVQHIEVASGPLQRRFGLASLKFYTAGGANVDLKMPGLTAADADRLREFILQRGGGDHRR